MERAEIVKVAVSAAPYAIDKPYDYLVPEPLSEGAVPGVRVSVPFGRGNRICEGIVLARADGEKVPGLKPISAVLDRAPVLDEGALALALWMRRRYFCTVYEAARTILPAGLWYRIREVWHLTDGADGADVPQTKKAVQVLDALREAGGAAPVETLQDLCGGEVRATLRTLEQAGAVRCETSAKGPAGGRTRRVAELAVPAADALSAAERGRSAPRREAVRFLAAAGRAACSDVTYYTGASLRVLRGLERAGLVRILDEEPPSPPPEPPPDPGPPTPLTADQRQAYEALRGLMDSGQAAVSLLYGVTGSGKTRVYLELVQHALDTGKSAMVLVPEIILTPQMMRAFTARFGGEAALLHSSLRVSERTRQWKRVRSGEARVVLGTRSAVFAPLRNPGVVILDEEQESSYQSEQTPRYHTLDVAKYLCARHRALLVLGSATPTVETAWSAEQGVYQRAVLRKRYNERSLPRVVIADLRQELRSGNAGTLGAALCGELERNLARGEQSILFLNRRGASRMLVCGECGQVPECPRCSVPMTYHSANRRLMCHYCGHSQWTMETCPVCGGLMKHIGAGTQKVEAELRERFPSAEVLRMDADTASGKHEAVLSRFERERIPILLGTQMVAKGLDFENVTLVGVLQADLSLYVDHYRAAERTFSLLTQVVGRAGRGEREGRAVIQTFTPENDVIQSAAAQDYGRFYRSELRLRRLRRCPPFADLFTLTVSGVEESAVLKAAAKVRDTLRALAGEPPLRAAQAEVLGPAPAPVLKVNNRFRYRVLLVGKNDAGTRDVLSWLLKEFSRDRANRGLNLFVDCNGLD